MVETDPVTHLAAGAASGHHPLSGRPVSAFTPMSRGHLHDGAPAPLPLRAGTAPGAAAAGGATLLTPLAAVEEWLADSGFLDEVLAGIEDGMLPGTPEEA